MRRTSVLIVDDSALVRQALSDIIAAERDLEVFGVAADPYIAAERMRKGVPDVILLDVEMPRMDGITFLQKIMSQRPVPVVMCSSFTEKGSAAAVRAMELGAVDVIEKPRLGTRRFLEEAKVRICDIVRAAGQARLRRQSPRREVAPRLSADAVLEPGAPRRNLPETEAVVVVGASTGGTEALRLFLQALPPEAPGIVIVQHMPEKFTAAFAARLDSICAIAVKEAEQGDVVTRGRALIAPGDRHTLLSRRGGRYVVEVKDGPMVSRHRPSVDVLFRSAARYAGRNAIGIIMTGMGDDGARGLLEMKESGARTIAQDEASCVIFGMPAEAIRLGAVDAVVPLERIGAEMLRLVDGGPAPLR